jgi:hypothetical protein
MTNQELYEKVIDHLLTMTKRAYEDYSCCYLTADGNKCAIGALLPPGEWQKCDGDVADLLNRWPQLIELLELEDVWFEDHDPEHGIRDLDGTTFNLMMALQNLHDDGSSWKFDGGLTSDALLKLAQVGVDYGLSVPSKLYTAA